MNLANNVILVDDLFDVRTEKIVIFSELIVIDPFQVFKIVLDTLVVLGFPGLAEMVNRGYAGHLSFSSKD